MTIFLCGRRVAMGKNKEAGTKHSPRKRNDLIWASTLGVNLVLSTGVGLFIGWCLDRWFQTTPVLTIVFFFIGTFAGFRVIYREIQKLGEDDKKDGLR